MATIKEKFLILKEKFLILVRRPEALVGLGIVMVLFAIAGIIGLLAKSKEAILPPTETPTVTPPPYTPAVATFTPAPTPTVILVTLEAATFTPLPQPTASATRTHTVAAGDTLLGIALDYDTTTEAIKAANGMADDMIYLGDVLIIPVSAVLPTATPVPPGEGVIHVVAENETLGGIALRYDITLEALLAANALDSADFIQVGQKLVIPGAEASTPTSTTP